MDELYRRGSRAQLRALSELRDELRRLGFYAEQARATEDTLRVYAERRHVYPLLNPRFEAPSGESIDAQRRSTLSIAVLSKGVPGLATRLLSFRSTTDCRFEHTAALEAGFRRHGFFRIQVKLRGGAPEVPSTPLRRIRECLTSPRGRA